MATKDPNSRLTEGSVNSPSYSSPNGITEQRGNTGGMSSGAPTASDLGRGDDETPGEKIGRFFRRAMDRLSGHDEDERRRASERDRQDRDTLERSRPGERIGQVGRSALPERGQGEWSDLGRSRDDRNLSYRSGPTGDTGGSSARYQPGSGTGGYGQGTTGRPYGQGQGSYGQSTTEGQGRYERDESRLGSSGQGQGAYGPSFENRGGQSAGQRTPGRSPGESYGLGEVPGERPIGSDRGFQGEQGRDDWNRGEWNRGPERWSERSARTGPTGLSTSEAGTGAWSGFGREEARVVDWGETARDLDRGQGRRFWQREPLAARDVMTRNPKTVSRQSSFGEAAVIMRDENCGVVPVVDASGRLEGILTDRDIVVRGLVNESTPVLRIEDVMSDDVSAVTEDEPLTSVLDLMGRRQVRRVPVVDREDRLLGIISMADIANRADYDEDLQDAFERISSRRSFWSLFS